MSTRDLAWLTPEIERAQRYHKARVAALYSGRPKAGVISIAGRMFGRSHGLSGNNEIERAFVLKDSGTRDGLEWLDATAKAPDTGFEKIAMAFNEQGELVIMELRDAFGLKTELRFSKMQRNPQLSPSLFKFVPPKGADVLGE